MINILKKIWKAWTSFIQLVNKVVVYVLLSLLFLLLITPQAYFRGFFIKNKKKNGLLLKEHRYTFNDLLKPW